MSLSCGQRSEVCFLWLEAGRNLPGPRGASIASGTGVPCSGRVSSQEGAHGGCPHHPGRRFGRDENDLSMVTVSREVLGPLDGRCRRGSSSRRPEGKRKSEGIEDPRVPLSFKTQLSAVEISSSRLPTRSVLTRRKVRGRWQFWP